MEFGVRLPVAGPFTTWEGITRMAIEAERLGYDALYAHDNILEEPGERAAFYTGSIEAQERRGRSYCNIRVNSCHGLRSRSYTANQDSS